jgi:hypothetical protein
MSHFKNSLGELVYLRSYARWLPSQGRRENWAETVDRAYDFLVSNQPVPEEVKEEIYDAIYHQDVMPSMRSLWASGEFAAKDNTAIYNCSFLPIDNLKAFSELLYILMQGTGVGFSVEKRFIENLPTVSSLIENHSEDITILQVEDSTEGWADAIYYLLVSMFKGLEVDLDYSLIRPRGSVLKTKGGRASGADPLRVCVSFIKQALQNARGRKLTTLECHDICCSLAEVVVVGGVRRSAMISFSDPDDALMRHAKDWRTSDFPLKRYMSNNSAFFEEKPTREVFDREWEQLALSGSGERGFSIDNWWRYADRPKGATRSNPCVTGDTRVMTEHGLVQIKDFLGSPKRLVIDSRFGTSKEGYTSEKGAFITGNREVFRLITKQGYEVKLTSDHKVMTPRGWVQAQYLKKGDSVHICNNGGMFGTEGNEQIGAVAGWYAGDGTIGRGSPKLYFYHEDRGLTQYFKECIEAVVGKEVNVSSYEKSKRDSIGSSLLRDYLPTDDRTTVPEIVWRGTEECQRAYLSALFSADGCVIGDLKKGASVRLHSTKIDHLKNVQQILLNFNICSKIYTGRMKEGFRMMPDGKGGLKAYFCKESSELVISCQSLVTFSQKIGFIREDKQNALCSIIDSYKRSPNRDKFFADFVSLEPLGVETVYDLTEMTTHSFIANGIVVHNCHEIGLRYTLSNNPWTGEGGGGQFCNLSAVVVRKEDTVEELVNKVRIATWIGCIQSTFTHFPYLRPAWARVSREDRLIGVDITGQCDNIRLCSDRGVLELLNNVAVSVAKEASEALGITMPVAITCGKPSGNTSQMLDCSSGFHPRYSPYYYRHVRLSADDPLSALLRDQGVPIFPEVGEENKPTSEVRTWVVRFPIKAPKDSVTRDQETSVQQMTRYLDIMQTWCKVRGHNQSATIYVKDGDWGMVGDWVWEHFDEIVGLSFLPYDGGNYKLAPYEELSEEEYLDMVQDFPEVDFTKLSDYEKTDMGEGSNEIACTGGICEI